MESLRGSLLVASSKLNDPFFTESVILITTYADHGTVGVIVNKPFPDAAKPPGTPYTLFNGGPLPHQKCMVLHAFESWAKSPRPAVAPGTFLASPEPVAPGIYMGDGLDLKRIMESDGKDAGSYRVIRGYASWGPGQLEAEIEHYGAWHLLPARGTMLWDVDPLKLWASLVPRSIPKFSNN